MVQLQELATAVILLVIVSLVAASGAIGLNDFADDFNNDNSTAENITNVGLDGVDNATQFLDTTGTILGISVLVGIIVTAFAVVARRV